MSVARQWGRRWAAGFAIGGLLFAAACAKGDPAAPPDDRDPPPAGAALLCLGDSITAGYGGVTGYPTYLAAAAGRPAVNAGRAYETSAGGAARAPALLDEHRPGVVTVLYGINDVQGGVDPAVVVANLRAIVRAARSRGARPVVGLVMPVRGRLAGLNPAVRRLDAAIAAMAVEEGAPSVDLYGVFLGRDDLYRDDVHPSDAGSRAIAAAFAPHLAP